VSDPPDLAARVVRWQRRHGRRGLPWQQERDPYRVWLSEVMLQQTQAPTVQTYYPRFLRRFPDLQALAAADEDEVLALWSGLGYYARARRLHQCARAIVQRHGGIFPRTAAALAQLPGIGRSTAAAIAAFCFHERAAILDGNVRRVLARALAVAHDLALARHQQALWQRAQALLPQAPAHMPAYTQGLMDLGALICTPRRPNCARCPLQPVCAAHRAGEPERYPVNTRRAAPTPQALWLLHATDAQGRTWLAQRPAQGIWARLHSLPDFDSPRALAAACPLAGTPQARRHPPIRHALTHRALELHIVSVIAPAGAPPLAQGARQGAWFAPHAWPALALPAPVRKFLAATGALS
jgi:A/G-specific adenine glycosylase